MPIAKVQLPDGRIGRFEVPEGTTEQQVIDFASSQSFTTPQPVQQTPTPPQGLFEGVGTPETFEPGPIQTGMPATAAVQPGAPIQNVPRERGEETFFRAAESAPGSLGDFGKNIVTPFIHPIQTAKSFRDLGAGIVGKLTPGDQESEKSVDALVNMFKGRYGSLEAAKETFATDPVGFLADIASLGVPVGAILKGAGVAGKVSTLSKVGTVTKNIALTLDPSSILLKGTGFAGKLVPEKLPSELYQSAAKFSNRVDLTIPMREKLAKTALVNEIMPTIKGYHKLSEKINDFNIEITKVIDAAADSGKQVPIKKIFRELKALERETLKTSGQPIERLNQINNIKTQIIEANKRLKRTSLTPKEAQAMKVRIYKETESYFDMLSTSPAKIDAQQAIARGLKKSIEDIIPGIKELNRNDGDLIALRKEISQSAKRISNRDIGGIGVPIKAQAGATMAGPQGALAYMTLGLLDTPGIKARMAIIMDKMRRKGIPVTQTKALTSLGFFQAGKLSAAGEEEFAVNP